MIGKGLARMTTSKVPLKANVGNTNLADKKSQAIEQSLINISNHSLAMDRSVFYKSYFGDCSSITNLDDSQLFHETKITKVSKGSKQLLSGSDQ